MSRDPRITAEPMSLSVVRQQFRRIQAEPLVQPLLDAMPELVVVLNEQRQIVAVNEVVSRWLGRPGEQLLGLRPGQAVDCVHADEPPAGCGTTEFCQACGAARAISESHDSGQPCARECRVLRREGASPPALDFEVSARPLTIAGERFLLLILRDIGDEKRRQLLERMFFHDVLNAAGGLRGLLEVWPELQGEEAREAEQLARQLAEQLLEEIESQRDLAAAERGDLAVRRADIDVAPLLEQVCTLYRYHPGAEGKPVPPPRIDGPTTLHTSESLLRRVLGNLIKNALEASRPGEAVTVGYAARPEPSFTIHNPRAMPPEVRLNIFQRSFSTKGAGRGIGSYSVKLLTERYLGGQVTFHTSEAEGTTFVVTLPGTAR